MINVEEPEKRLSGGVLFDAGHRPFFMLTGAAAFVFVLVWIMAYRGVLPLSVYWHGHEMLYGFAGAAIAGFIMAAVPKWTNVASPTGLSLIALVLLWLLARVCMVLLVTGSEIPLLWVGDVLFLPALFLVTARMIIKGQNNRNYIVLVLLAGLILSNFYYHLGNATQALYGGIYFVTALAVLISGRVIPAFTQNALRQFTGEAVECKTPGWTHMTLQSVLVLFALVEMFNISEKAGGLLALVISGLLFYRMKGWRSLNSFFDPLVWVLHAAYIWLPIGFLLKALAVFTDIFEATAALHALTVGGIGLLILAVSSRAALGHSGRALKASKRTVVAYLLVFMATFLRVFALNHIWIDTAGLFWCLGFALFVWVYAPILWKARIDGMPG